MNSSVISTDSAELSDIGNGIGRIKFKSKSNSISPGVIDFLKDVLDNDFYGFNGLVIVNEGNNFLVGADLNAMLEKIDNGNYGNPNDIGDLHRVLLKLKHYHKPIVAAPFGYTLGGGCEVVMHCHGVVCCSKLHMGLVEVGVGLVPAGGGTKESLLKVLNYSSELRNEKLISLFDRLIIRTWSKNAKEAIEWNLLPANTTIVESTDQLLAEAKVKCLELVDSFEIVESTKTYSLGGKDVYDMLMDHAQLMHSDGTISSHDLTIAHYIALILSGGNDHSSYNLSERDICILEMYGLSSLRATAKTKERISYLLETGDMLRN